MIKSYKSKKLKAAASGDYSKIDPRHQSAVRVVLAALDTAAMEGDFSLPGKRLHQFISHLILSHSNLIPEQPDVNAALAILFTEYCHHDFTEFWHLLSLGGLLFSSGQSPILKPCLSELPAEVKKLSDVIFAHYGTILRSSPIEHEK